MYIIAKNKIKGSFIALSALSMIGLSGQLFAAPTSGQLVIINSLGVMVDGNTGSSASNALVQVSDSTGVCATTTSLAYGGIMTVTWNAANVHSLTKCTNIASISVSALKNASGFVQYDSTANATPPTTATAPTVFTAPTTAISNLAIIVTGTASPAMTNSATSWGSALGVAPVYSTANGGIDTTGIMGAVGIAGMKASKYMLKYGIMPAGETPYVAK